MQGLGLSVLIFGFGVLRPKCRGLGFSVRVLGMRGYGFLLPVSEFEGLSLGSGF